MSDAVLDLLNKQQLAFTVSGRDYLLHCLNPEHDDSNPSFRVDRLSGAAHCFSCGFKTNIFKHFNVFTNPVPIRVAKLKQKLQDLQQSQYSLEYPKGYTPYTKSFRNISAQTLKHFGAFYTQQFSDLEDRIVFPITDIRDKIVVFVGRHTLSNGNPKYKNYPAGVRVPVFPVRVQPGCSSIVLVEGIFDMLNLYDKGLQNAVCCFGTNTLQRDTQDKLMPFRTQGITKVYILFDGDEAGRKAAKILKPLIEELEFQVEIIDLPDDLDPGELSVEMVEQIKNYINEA